MIWEKENLLYFFILTELRFCLLLLTKQNFSQKSNLDDSGISSSAFHFRTILTEQYFFNWIIFLLLVKKVINNLDLSRASGPGCIPVMVLKIREPQLSYKLACFFNMCLQESYFPDSWKVSVFKNLWSLYLRMVGKGLSRETTVMLSLLSVISRFFENL